jgi:hypothetical protein
VTRMNNVRMEEQYGLKTQCIKEGTQECERFSWRRLGLRPDRRFIAPVAFAYFSPFRKRR